MSFLPEHITIPKENGQQNPVGMKYYTLVALFRDIEGRLIIEFPKRTLAVRKEDETPERIAILIDKFYDFNKFCLPMFVPKKANEK